MQQRLLGTVYASHVVLNLGHPEIIKSNLGQIFGAESNKWKLRSCDDLGWRQELIACPIQV